MKEEIYFFDNEGNIVESEEDATKAVVRETDENGVLVSETWLVLEK